MTWTSDFPDLESAREQARKAFSLPIGLSSPLWVAFGAAAGAGVAWWWATRWTRAVNLEAMVGAAEAQIKAVEVFVERESKAAVQAVGTTEALLAAVVAVEPQPPVVADRPVEVIAETLEGAVADDLTQLTGIGPKLAAALNARGITTFAQLAAWTEENAAAFDAELSLKGRVARDAWVAQARRLAGED